MEKVLKCVCGYNGKMFELEQFNKLGLQFPINSKINNEPVSLYVCPKCGTVRIG